MTISDIAGLSKPLSKLIGVVSEGIGTLYRPTKIRREAAAHAHAQQIAALAKAKTDIKVRELQFDALSQRVETLLSERPDLAERARMRVLTREIEGVLNIEAIADAAATELPNDVSDKPLDADWRRKFFLEAENVCDADMQLLWGKILAGEIAAPGTFSVRSLDTLRRLSRSEAEIFQRACSLAMKDGWIALPSQDLNVALELFGLPFDSILALRDAGLLQPSDTLAKIFKTGIPLNQIMGAAPSQNPIPAIKIRVELNNNGVLIQLTSPAETFHVPALIFTKSGTELQRLINDAANPQYLTSIGEALRRQGVTAKRGTTTQVREGLFLTTFEQDL